MMVLWFTSNTTQATGVTIEFLSGSSAGLSPAWPGNNDLDSIPNTVQTYAFDQNVSDTGTNLQISVSIVNSVITLSLLLMVVKLGTLEIQLRLVTLL